MKELTLLNRYHQIQTHPKPPVEQRVKVMDTLNKDANHTRMRRPVGRRTFQDIRPIAHSIFERLRRLQTLTRGSRT